jgi:hypothetical protein
MNLDSPPLFGNAIEALKGVEFGAESSTVEFLL